MRSNGGNCCYQQRRQQFALKRSDVTTALVCVLAMLVVRGVSLGVNTYAGFNIAEDGIHYAVGNIHSQGSATNDWAGAWTATISGTDPTFAFDVAAGGSEGGTGDQCLAILDATSSSHKLQRLMDAWNGDFSFSFDVRLSGSPTGAPAQLQLEKTVGGARALHLKWEIGGTLTLNGISFTRSYVTSTDGFRSMTGGEWVSVKVVCDWGTGTFDLYCEKTDGSLGLWGSMTGFRDATFLGTDAVTNFRIDGVKGGSMWVDNMRFALPVFTNARNPSPANGTTIVTPATSLSWTAGQYALSHDVYFGTNQSEVMNAQRLLGDIKGDGPADILDLAVLGSQWMSNPGAVNPSADITFSGKVDFADFAALGADWHQTPNAAFKGNQSGTTYNPGTLANGITYYWRIDEVNSADPQSPYKGEVWHFSNNTNAPGTDAIMPLGDSITEGSYRYYLWSLLVNSGHNNVNFVGSLYKMYNNTTVDSRVYDQDHEGHFGWRDDQIAASVYGWLQQNPPDIILLHIGTNGLEESPAHVADILNEIDRYESNYSRHIKVILARIINRNPYSALTSTFNSNVAAMAQTRINSGDDIVIVDMENGAGINYSTDMYDDKHPNEYGYQKMANLWFSTLQTILP